MKFHSEVDAICAFNTDGSEISTILSAYLDMDGLLGPLLACAAHNAPDGRAAAIRFAIKAGTSFLVEVGGTNGAGGFIALNWAISSDLTPSTNLPVLIKVRRGGRLTLAFDTHEFDNSFGVTNLGPANYQWLFNGQPLTGVAGDRLTISNVQASHAGVYAVHIFWPTNFEQRIATVEVDLGTVALLPATFEGNAEGWQITGSATNLAYSPAGGQSDGFISASSRNTNVWFWTAPSSYHSDLSASYGGWLEFELRQSSIGSSITNKPLVTLNAGALQISFFSSQAPGLNWTAFKVPLIETASGWTYGTGTAPPTFDQMFSVLRGLTGLSIRGQFSLSTNTTSIDTVALVGLCTNQLPLFHRLIAGTNGITQLRLEWSVVPPCFQLETTASLSSPSWNRVPVPVPNAPTNSYTAGLTNRQQFFRLRQF
jgi:hypothetical protein